jgi:hypothetical protein
LVSHFHHIVADKIYIHHKNLVAGQHVEIFDPKTKTGGIFIDHVNTFLKQEASGRSEWCQSENDKWGYIRDYHEKEGILLNSSVTHVPVNVLSLSLC